MLKTILILFLVFCSGCHYHHITPKTLANMPVEGFDVQVILKNQVSSVMFPGDEDSTEQTTNKTVLSLWGKIEGDYLKTSIIAMNTPCDNIDFAVLEGVTKGKVLKYGWCNPEKPIRSIKEPWLVMYKMERF